MTVVVVVVFGETKASSKRFERTLNLHLKNDLKDLKDLSSRD